MRKILCLLFCLCIMFALAACNSTRNEQNTGSASLNESPQRTTLPVPAVSEPTSTARSSASPGENGVISINISVGSSTFTATLNDNETTQALVAQFPMTLQMNELNGLEKYNDLSEDLPAASTERPATIHAGDIMCWSGNTLVLFYQTFSNSNGGYVSLGSVDDPSNLATALGSGNSEVTWSLAD
ncbi:MAG: hypothetical protein K6T94_15605 [Paenibacillus sp.]|nr:hypothetical protein [Paenibacillus sp.]